MKLKIGPITRAQRKRLKLQEDNGMILYLKEALKNLEGFESQEKVSKLFSIYLISKYYSRE